MDPQATWEQLLEAYAESDWDRVADLAEGLLHWLSRGGFFTRVTEGPPRATTASDLGQDWDREIALAACRFALSRTAEEVSDVPS